MLTELLPDCEAKVLLEGAVIRKNQGDYLGCLIDVRKALFAEYEHEYAVHRWANVNSGDQAGLFYALGRGGMKAPYYVRNKDWIAQNVNTPIDYVQIDYQEMRNDALQWGISTSLLDNLRRLTPQVFRAERDSDWRIEYDRHFPANEANESNCNYCLDLAISILVKKKEHERLRRWPRRDHFDDPLTIYVGQPLYKQARSNSEVVQVVQEGYVYTTNKVVSGFLDGENFVYVSGNRPPTDENEYGSDFVYGFLLHIEQER